MVANSFFGRSKSVEIIWIGLDLFSKPSSISVCVSENNATSAPEMSAEHINNRNYKTNPPITGKLIVINTVCKLTGSGSNIYHFN